MDETLRRRLVLARARDVPRATIARVLGVSDETAAHYAERVGAGEACSFAQFTAVVWLSGPDERNPRPWHATATAIDEFLRAYVDPSTAPELAVDDSRPMLATGSAGAAVLRRQEALDYPDNPAAAATEEAARVGELFSVGPLLPMVEAMLDELDKDRAP